MSKLIQLNKVVIMICFLFISISIGQVTQNFIPYSLNMDQSFERTSIVLPSVDVEKLMYEDEERTHSTMLRFGYEHEVNHTFLELANQSINSDGQILLMEYSSYDAFAVRAIFEPFYLPEGVSLFVYNNNMSQIEGAYTSENNNDAMYFSTPLIEGDHIIIELNVENGVSLGDIQLNISKIIHDYRGFIQMMENNYSNRQCANDIMCEEAEPYIDQINSAALLEMAGGICSGAMVNNMNEDFTPYFLSAHHCTYNENPQGFRFHFNYYRQGCNEGAIDWGEYAFSSVIRSDCNCHSNWWGPDYVLLEITDDIPIDWDVYYAGFNATDPIQMPVSVGVHHPGGAPKRINYDSGFASWYEWDSSGPHDTHWWFTWDDGGTEGGSSGSAVYDDAGRIAGVLSGGNGDCELGTGYDLYGKIATSWEWGISPETRLKDWLDPENTGELLLGGTYNIPPVIGDVNSDQILNIQDVIIVINFILNIVEPVDPQHIIADLNLDHLINIQDILLIINIIVNG